MKIAALATSFVIGFCVGLALIPAKPPTISADHHKQPVVYEMQRRFQN